jgi:hypothetical protein
MTGVVGNGWHRLLRVCFLKFHPGLPGRRRDRPPTRVMGWPRRCIHRQDVSGGKRKHPLSGSFPIARDGKKSFFSALNILNLRAILIFTGV